MERDYGAEIDELRKELLGIRKLLTNTAVDGNAKGNDTFHEHIGRAGKKENDTLHKHMADAGKKENGTLHKHAGHVEKMEEMHPDPAVMTLLGRVEDTCGSRGECGCLTYIGVFASGGRQSTWIRNEVSADRLLELIENRTAERVLACIGNNDRLNILLAIMKKPMTVAQLVEECGYHSTGQVYHHLKPLVTADLIVEDSQNLGKGYYVVQPHRVQGIIMLLAGISDMVDPQYTQGSWGKEVE